MIGLDGSEASEHALYTAVGLAQREGVRLIAVHVRRPGHSGLVGALAPVDVVTAARGAAEDAARASAQETCESAGVSWEFRVRTGSPPLELRDVAKETRAGLLVVGTRGSGLAARWHRMTAGSVSAHLVRHEPTPVLVVR